MIIKLKQLSSFFKKYENNTFFVITKDNQEAEILYHYIKFHYLNTYYYPDLNQDQYDIDFIDDYLVATRSATISQIKHCEQNSIIVLTIRAMSRKIQFDNPIFKNRFFIEVQKRVVLEDIIHNLAYFGYKRQEVALNIGEFAARGDIIDIISNNQAIRVKYHWDIIGSIEQFDPLTQRTTNKNFNIYEIFPIHEICVDDKAKNYFLQNFTKFFSPDILNSNEYNFINSSQYHDSQYNLLPILSDNLSSVINIPAQSILLFYCFNVDDLFHRIEEIKDLYNSQIAKQSFVCPPENLFLDKTELYNYLQNTESYSLEDDGKVLIPEYNLKKDKDFINFIDINKNSKIFIGYETNKQMLQIQIFLDSKQIQYLMIEHISESKQNFVHICPLTITQSYIDGNKVYLSAKEILRSPIVTNINNRKRLKNILAELDALNIEDLVVHEDYGIGRYAGIEVLNLKGMRHDCLKIFYANNDVIYVPVEHSNLVKKYGYEYAVLDKLGSIVWQRRKAEQKNKIRDIAKSLVKTAAKRKLIQTNVLEIDNSLYQKFCDTFPYNLSIDQANSIKDIQKDILSSGKLMYRLLCGDVGFGKTEVAMHAVFTMLSCMHKYSRQVVVISPTTILSRQHYNSFVTRFKNFNFSIVEVSRLVPTKQLQKNIEDIKTGEADIVIGTHALLSKKIEFLNLKLIIVDEEQQFGVKQKEYLKELQGEIHVLSLSATPIPRTLQLALSGIQDLSLIATPPKSRLPIKTDIIGFNKKILKEALIAEKRRGGRSLFISPFIKDLDSLEKDIKLLTPELTIVIVHARMPSSKIDDIMMNFYNAKIDVLVATTIVGSGLDVPNVNSIFINKAEFFGLSQLYQLRGRVGRNNIQAFAYLIVRNKKNITKHAYQRLEIMASVKDLGMGFSVASHDMDIRGYGNLLGNEQAGKVKEVGIDLYQQMLEEAIEEEKLGKTIKSKFDTYFNIEVPIYIPENYIEDQHLRLAMYNRVSTLSHKEEIDVFMEEMNDRFGEIPVELRNLLQIIDFKIRCQDIGIKKIDKGANGFSIEFIDNIQIADKLMEMVINNPQIYKLKPNNKLIVVKLLRDSNVLMELDKILLLLSKFLDASQAIE